MKPDILELLGATVDTVASRIAGVQAVTTERLRMVPVDLREMDEMDALLRSSGLQIGLPTIFICECVLVYMHPQQSDALIAWAAQLVTAPAAIITYEHTSPHTPFGQQMMQNLNARGCPLLSLPEYPTLESQLTRRMNYLDLKMNN